LRSAVPGWTRRDRDDQPSCARRAILAIQQPRGGAAPALGARDDDDDDARSDDEWLN
jgi:hypothetical protein